MIGYVTLLFLCVGGIAAYAYYKKSDFGKADKAYRTPRHLQYSFILRNTTGRVAANAKLWTFAPVKQTAYQLCHAIEASHPFQTSVDHLGNQILEFTFEALPPFATKVVSIRASLGLADNSQPIHAEHEAHFLKASQYIDSNHPGIVAQADKITSHRGDRAASDLFNWVALNMKYTGYRRDGLGANYALQHMQGDCTEFASLFAALCRAKKIPARTVGGYFVTQDAILKPDEFHNWSEFYHGNRWHLADPQKKYFKQNPSAYIAFKIMDDLQAETKEVYIRYRVGGEGLQASMNGS